MYPGQEATQEAGEVRQASPQMPQPDRDHICQAQGQAEGGNPIPVFLPTIAFAALVTYWL